MKRYYPAIIDKDAGSDFGISFPDFPGCVSAGTTIEEAVAQGTEALALHVAGMAEDGEPIPEPSQVDRLARDPKLRPAAIVLVPAVLPSRPVRINVTMDSALIEEIDSVARNRSGFLAEAARAELARRKE